MEQTLFRAPRIATSEPENPLYDGAVQRMSSISEALRNTYEDLGYSAVLFHQSEIILKVRTDSGWFHMQ